MDWEMWQKIPGWLSLEEGAALQNIATEKTVLEIGSYCGKSTVAMARTASRIYSLDHHKGDQDAGYGWTLPAFLMTLDNWQVRDKVSILLGRTDEFVPILGAYRFDVVFVDGAHDYNSVHYDIETALQVLHPDGVICLHDSNTDSVSKAINELLPARNREVVGTMVIQPLE